MSSFSISRRAVATRCGVPEICARLFAVGNPALADLIAVWGVDDLVVGVIELLLVHVEPDQRPCARGLSPRRSCGGARGEEHICVDGAGSSCIGFCREGGGLQALA